MRKAMTVSTAAAIVVIAVLYSVPPEAQQRGPQSAEARSQTDRLPAALQGQSKSLQCIACHGPSGISPNPMFPHLAGQNASYLEIQLENFKTGERYHPLMTPVAQALSREDIADLASYFSRIGPLAGAPSVGTEP